MPASRSASPPPPRQTALAALNPQERHLDLKCLVVEAHRLLLNPNRERRVGGARSGGLVAGGEGGGDSMLSMLIDTKGASGMEVKSDLLVPGGGLRSGGGGKAGEGRAGGEVHPKPSTLNPQP